MWDHKSLHASYTSLARVYNCVHAPMEERQSALPTFDLGRLVLYSTSQLPEMLPIELEPSHWYALVSSGPELLMRIQVLVDNPEISPDLKVTLSMVRFLCQYVDDDDDTRNMASNQSSETLRIILDALNGALSGMMWMK
jgi:hypothetical protein